MHFDLDPLLAKQPYIWLLELLSDVLSPAIPGWSGGVLDINYDQASHFSKSTAEMRLCARPSDWPEETQLVADFRVPPTERSVSGDTWVPCQVHVIAPHPMSPPCGLPFVNSFIVTINDAEWRLAPKIGTNCFGYLEELCAQA